MAVKAIDLETFLSRQQEIFNAYIENNGKETSLLPFIEIFTKVDECGYEDEEVLVYLNSYVKSKQISDKELEEYNETKKVPNDLIFKRGKVITEALIENEGSLDIIPRYAAYYAKKDGKINSYSEDYPLKCRDYYLSNTKNKGMLFAYENVKELSKRGHFDIELVLKILEIPDNASAINFVHKINISKESLMALIRNYQALYPADGYNINRLNNICKYAFAAKKKTVKFVDLKRNKDLLEHRLIILRRMLEEYLISDYEDISSLFVKFNFNTYKFNETLKDAVSKKDPMLNSLISKYYTKLAVVMNNYKIMIDSILQAAESGINYGYGYRELNTYDYYTLKNGVSSATLLEYAKKIYNEDDFEKVSDIVSQFDQDNIRGTRVSLKKELDEIDEHTDEIIDYLEYVSLPLTVPMYKGVLTRFKNNDISFENNQKVVNI